MTTSMGTSSRGWHMPHSKAYHFLWNTNLVDTEMPFCLSVPYLNGRSSKHFIKCKVAVCVSHAEWWIWMCPFELPLCSFTSPVLRVDAWFAIWPLGILHLPSQFYYFVDIHSTSSHHALQAYPIKYRSTGTILSLMENVMFKEETLSESYCESIFITLKKCFKVWTIGKVDLFRVDKLKGK